LSSGASHAHHFGRDPPLADSRRGRAFHAAKQLPAPYELVKWCAENGKLPVVNFSAGGIATPADAALMMQLGARASSSAPVSSRATTGQARVAIVRATTNYKDAAVLAEVSVGLGNAMPGIDAAKMAPEAKIQTRGW